MKLEAPAGVEAFNLWTIWIMARLWEEFPRPQWFHNATPKVVLVTSNPQVAGTPIGPEGREQVELFRHTMTWLLDEGFARGIAKASGDFPGVSLTTRGFSVLNQVPRSIDAGSRTAVDKPLGALMREAVISHGVGIAGGLIAAMIQQPPRS